MGQPAVLGPLTRSSFRQSVSVGCAQPIGGAEDRRCIINPNYGYASRRWLVSEMDGLPGLKA
jgi:hypothetical protein